MACKKSLFSFPFPKLAGDNVLGSRGNDDLTALAIQHNSVRGLATLIVSVLPNPRDVALDGGVKCSEICYCGYHDARLPEIVGAIGIKEKAIVLVIPTQELRTKGEC